MCRLPFAWLFGCLALVASCGKPLGQGGETGVALSGAPSSALAPAPEPEAPEIIVDASTVAIGRDRVALGDAALADRVAAVVAGRPRVEGQSVQVVVMRNAKPRPLADVIDGLRRAKATGVTVKSEARDGTTTQIALSFPASVPDCTATAWIGKDGAIHVWPAGGGTAKRVIRGLAGPDMTLGLAAVRERSEGCTSPQIVIGADDPIPWGVLFDLAEGALHGGHLTEAILVTRAAPGRKVTLR